MPVTVSVIKANLGTAPGHRGLHPAMLESARSRLATAVMQGALSDAQAHAAGDDLALVLVHAAGEEAEPVHRLAWETLIAAAALARDHRLTDAGRGLLGDTFPGQIAAAGPAVAEITFEERPAEPLLVLLGTQAATGAFNLPLYRAFADPFNTPGLVLAEALHEGFTFEVHDTRLQRKIVFMTPAEAYDLLAFIGAPSRFVVKRVVSRGTAEVGAVASSTRLADLGGAGTNDGPVAVIRCGGAFPTAGEIVEPFATPTLVEGGMRGSHVAPWMPVALAEATPGRWDGPPRVVALGLQVVDGRLTGPRDLFADVAFNGARRAASDLADVIRRHGPFEPHRLPMEEAETLSLPPRAARLAGRWAPL